MIKYFLFILFPVMFFALSAGCSQDPHSMINYSGVDLVKGNGRITLDDQPLPYAQIFFEDIDRATTAWGLTDENGYYTLMFNSAKEGIQAGEKRVSIWTSRGGIEFGNKIPRENLGRGKERVPVQYNRKTELQRTVLSSKEQRSQTFDFELKSQGKIDSNAVPEE